MKNIKARRSNLWQKINKTHKQAHKRNNNLRNNNNPKDKTASNVTDHAIVRYIQRKNLVDVPAIIKEIQDIIYPSKTLGDGIYYKDGLAVVVADGKAITTWTKEFAHERSKKR